MNRAFVLAYIISFSVVFAPAIEALAATAQSNTITIKASCTYSHKYGQQTVYAEKILTLITPGGTGSGPSPVYITGCWRRTATSDGEATYIFDCPIATGWNVRAFVWKAGEKVLVDGVQAADGRVVVNGTAYDRVPGM